MQVHCPRCENRVELKSRSILWWVALAALGVFFVSMVLAASLIGPFITMGVFLLSSLGFAFGPLVSLCTEEPTCPKCGRSLAPRYMKTPQPTRRRPLVAQPTVVASQAA